MEKEELIKIADEVVRESENLDPSVAMYGWKELDVEKVRKGILRRRDVYRVPVSYFTPVQICLLMVEIDPITERGSVTYKEFTKR